MKDLKRKYGELYTIEEIADYLKVSDRTVRRYIANGILPTVKIGGVQRIPELRFKDHLYQTITKSPDPDFTDKIIRNVRRQAKKNGIT